CKDGSLIDVSVTSSMTRNHEGKVYGISEVISNITERKKTQKELRESQQNAVAALIELRHQKFALDQHAIVALTDLQGTITYVNEKFCEISGYTAHELIGQNHRILNSGLHPKQFFTKMYHTISAGKVWNGEICNRAKNGNLYWVMTTIVPYLDNDGLPT